MDRVDKALRNWKIHGLALALTVVAELIGSKSFKLGPWQVVLVPMLYAFILGALCGIPKLKLLDREDMLETSSLVGVTFFLLLARYGTLVGPNFWLVINSSLPLVLQEFGNLGTVFFGIPVAVLLGLRREAVGAAFSIAREGGVALIGSKYGLDSPEGLGVMGVYVSGTVFGTIFCSLLASFVATTMPFFSPQALAMAAGTGSASMMTASLASLVSMFPDMADELTALAVSSNMLSGLDGVYMSIFMGIPLANWLVRLLGVKDAPSVPGGAVALEPEEKQEPKAEPGEKGE